MIQQPLGYFCVMELMHRDELPLPQRRARLSLPNAAVLSRTRVDNRFCMGAGIVRFGRVEDGRGSWGPMANAPFPIPAHQTGRADFRHPAFRLASPHGTRRQRDKLIVRGFGTVSNSPSPLDTAISGGACH